MQPFASHKHQAELCSYSNGIRAKERQRAFPFEATAQDATYRLQDFHSEGSVSTLVRLGQRARADQRKLRSLADSIYIC